MPPVPVIVTRVYQKVFSDLCLYKLLSYAPEVMTRISKIPCIPTLFFFCPSDKKAKIGRLSDSLDEHQMFLVCI